MWFINFKIVCIMLCYFFGFMVCASVHWATRSEQELLGFLNRFYFRGDGSVNMFVKPLFSCLACMGSFWGVVIYVLGCCFLPVYFGLFDWAGLVVYVLVLSTVNRVGGKLLDWLAICVELWDYDLRERAGHWHYLQDRLSEASLVIEQKDAVISAMEKSIEEMTADMVRLNDSVLC